MADNVTTDNGIIATDEIAGAQVQRVKPVIGPDGSGTDLEFGQKLAAASLPVVLASDQSAVSVSLPGVATEATLAAIAADVDRLPVLVSGRMPTDGSGVTQPVSGTVGISGSVAVTGALTDAQLRAAAVPVSLLGVATEATLATMNGKTPSLGQAAMVASQPVAIASDQSAVPVSLPVMAATPFTQAGVIAIGDLLVIDCTGVEAVSIQCTSMGTSGVITPGWSNDGTNYVAASIMTPAGVSNATFNVAGLWTTPVLGRFFRLRLTTGASGGTTTLSVQRLPQANALPTVSQPVAVAGTVPVSGSLTSAGTVTNTPVTPSTTFTNSAGTTNAAVIKASAGTVWSLIAFNAGASPAYVKLYNLAVAPTVGTSTPAIPVLVPAGGNSPPIEGGANGIRFATGIAIAIVTGAAHTDATPVAASQVTVAISWT